MQHSPLHEFLEAYYPVPGASVPFAAFRDAFAAYLAKLRLAPWDDEQIIRALGRDYPVGRGARNVVRVGNLSDRPPRRFIQAGDTIRLSA